MSSATQTRGLGAIVGALLCVLVGTLSVGVAGASGYRKPIVHEPTPPPGFEPEEEWLLVKELPFGMEEEIEGACGLALAPSFGPLYVSDYYHHAVHKFSPGGGMYGGTIKLPGGDSPITSIKESNSVCGLAADGSGNLYGSYFHGRVVRLLSAGPSEEVIDPGYSTGIAVDKAGDLYVDHRTYVSVYEFPIAEGDLPAKTIGLGSLEDAYGIAVDPEGEKVYVADAGDETVKIYEPAVKLDEPVKTIDGPSGEGFNSLTDTSLAVDSSEFEAGKKEGEGHLLVIDNLKPAYERPAAAVYEFGSTGKSLDRLQTRTVGPPGVKKDDGPIFGEPSGIVVDPKSGKAFVTTGNSEESNVLLYGPFLKEAPPKSSVMGGDGASSSSLAPAAPEQSAGPNATASLAPAMSLEAMSGTGHRRRACRRRHKRAIARHSKRSCSTKAGAR